MLQDLDPQSDGLGQSRTARVDMGGLRETVSRHRGAAGAFGMRRQRAECGAPLLPTSASNLRLHDSLNVSEHPGVSAVPASVGGLFGARIGCHDTYAGPPRPGRAGLFGVSPSDRADGRGGRHSCHAGLMGLPKRGPRLRPPPPGPVQAWMHLVHRTCVEGDHG